MATNTAAKSKSKAKSKTKTSTFKTFVWQGVNKRGEKITGEVNATNSTVAKAELRRQNIVIKKIKRKPQPLFSTREKKITSEDITVFSRQLATMLCAGIALVQALDIVGRGHENPNVRELVLNIKTEIESGKTLSEALRGHPKYFNALFVNLIDAGEQSGALDVMLDKVATYQEKSESLRKKIKKAMTYPAAVIVIAFAVTAGLLIYVVPQFESLFKGFGADLPIVTQMVVNMSQFFQAYWWIIFGSIAASIMTFRYMLQTSESFAFAVDAALLKAPIIGNILQKAAIARFARTLAITFAAGLPLVDALKSVAGTTGNLLYTKATLEVRDQVETGQQMQLAMRQTKLFPTMVIQMVAIGEESGSLESMLSKVADFYEEEVDTAVDGLSSLLEPIIMVVLGVLIGGLVIAMYMPIFQLGGAV